jgi:hypothetical protein
MCGGNISKVRFFIGRNIEMMKNTNFSYVYFQYQNDYLFIFLLLDISKVKSLSRPLHSSFYLVLSSQIVLLPEAHNHTK